MRKTTTKPIEHARSSLATFTLKKSTILGLVLSVASFFSTELRAEDPKSEPAENPPPVLPERPQPPDLPGNRISRTDRPIPASRPDVAPKPALPASNAPALRSIRSEERGVEEVEFPAASDELMTLLHKTLEAVKADEKTKADVSAKIQAILGKLPATPGHGSFPNARLKPGDEVTVILCPVRFTTPEGLGPKLKPGEIRSLSAQMVLLGTKPASDKVLPSEEKARLYLGGLGVDPANQIVADPDAPQDLAEVAFRNTTKDTANFSYAFDGEPYHLGLEEAYKSHALKADDQLHHPFGLVKFLTRGVKSPCCYLVPRGYYEFVPNKSGAWDLAPAAFALRIDNTRNPNDFVYSLGETPCLVQARQIDTIVGRFPHFRISYKENEVAKRIERRIKPGTLNIRVAELGDFLHLFESAPKEIDGHELGLMYKNVIIKNREIGSLGPIAYDLILDPADDTSFARRYLRPGDAELHPLNGRPSFEGRFSPGDGIATTHRLLKPGSYRFGPDSTGRVWELYGPEPYSLVVTNKSGATLSFFSDQVYSIEPNHSKELKANQPISIVFDRGDGRGLTRKALPYSMFNKKVKEYQFVYDTKMSRFDIRPTFETTSH